MLLGMQQLACWCQGAPAAARQGGYWQALLLRTRYSQLERLAVRGFRAPDQSEDQQHIRLCYDRGVAASAMQQAAAPAAGVPPAPWVMAACSGE